MELLKRALFGAEPLEPSERRSILWSALVAGLVLGSWYFIRPVRDEIASRQGSVLASLNTATFVVMLAVMPLYAAVVRRSTRRRLLPGLYLTFAGLLVAFWAALQHTPPELGTWVERTFFVWASVFNVFAISIFWALMADVFSEPQGRRFFGAIAAGGSLGGIIGSAGATFVLSGDAPRMSTSTMLLVAAGVLALSIGGLRGIHLETRAHTQDPAPDLEDQPIRGTIWPSLLAPFRSAYLFGVCAYLFLYTSTSTFLYFQQTSIIGQTITDKSARAALFAQTDLWVNALTFVAQLLLASRAMLGLGVGLTLCILPVLTALGFGALAIAPTVGVVMVFQVARRVANFSLARPAREVLFTIVAREDKYKAKALIDTVIYRGGDTASAWLYTGIDALGHGLGFMAGVASGLSAAWLAVAHALGRRHRAATTDGAPTTSPRWSP